MQTRQTGGMRVLGVDPGYDRLGVAILEKNGSKEIVVFSDCITTDKRDTSADRIHEIGVKILEIMEEYNPEALAIEKLFFNQNQKTAFGVSELRGVIIYEAKKRGMEVFEYTPLEIKVATTGYGRADKRQMINMVQRLVKMPEKKKILDDEYDAVAAAITCLAREHF